MTQAQIAVPARIARSALIALAAVFVIGVFAMGFDQGHILSVVEGSQAFDTMYLHELSHDVRHAAGFPCH